MKKILILFIIILGLYLCGTNVVLSQMESPTYRIEDDSISGSDINKDALYDRGKEIFAISSDQHSESKIASDYNGVWALVVVLILIAIIFSGLRFKYGKRVIFWRK